MSVTQKLILLWTVRLGFGKIWNSIKKNWMEQIKKPIEFSGKNAEIRLFEAITDFLKKAACKPLVICIDDLHWADEQIFRWLNFEKEIWLISRSDHWITPQRNDV